MVMKIKFIPIDINLKEKQVDLLVETQQNILDAQTQIFEHVVESSHFSSERGRVFWICMYRFAAADCAESRFDHEDPVKGRSSTDRVHGSVRDSVYDIGIPDLQRVILSQVIICWGWYHGNR